MDAPSSERGHNTCALCLTPLDPSQILQAHICKHRLCQTCWFNLSKNSHGEGDELYDHNYCAGASGCFMDNLTTASSTGNKTRVAKPASTNAREATYWRHGTEGIRLLEAMIHDDVRKHVRVSLRVQSAAKLDSGVTDRQYAIDSILKVFNNPQWECPVRFQDDIHLQSKVNPNDNPKPVNGDTLSKKICDALQSICVL